MLIYRAHHYRIFDAHSDYTIVVMTKPALLC